MTIKFNDLKKPDKSNLLVVDALNLAFRYKHANKSDFGVEYLRTVQSLAQSYNCGTIIITADDGHSAYRRSIYPEYKMDRKIKYANQTEEEKQAFVDFFEDYNKTLDLLKGSYDVLQYKNVEADDIGAYIVKQKKKYNINKIWLISSDKDWDLLIQEDVSRFSYVTRKETTMDNWWDHYPISQEHYVGYKALTGGDDNIMGVEQVGPKRARDLLDQYGNIFDLLDQLPINKKLKFIQNLNNSKDRVLLNINLVDLLTYCEDAIGIGNIQEIDNVLAKLFNS